MGLRLDDVVALLKGRRKREKHAVELLRPYEQATAAPGEKRPQVCRTCGHERQPDENTRCSVCRVRW